MPSVRKSKREGMKSRKKFPSEFRWVRRRAKHVSHAWIEISSSRGHDARHVWPRRPAAVRALGTKECFELVRALY